MYTENTTDKFPVWLIRDIYGAYRLYQTFPIGIAANGDAWLVTLEHTNTTNQKKILFSMYNKEHRFAEYSEDYLINSNRYNPWAYLVSQYLQDKIEALP